MKNTLNLLICTAGIFLLSYCWASYCLKSTSAALWAATIISACFACIFRLAQGRHEKRIKEKSTKKARLLALTDYLRYGASNDELIGKLLSYYDFENISTDFNELRADKNGEKYLVEICFEGKTVSDERLCVIIARAKRARCTKTLVFCENASKTIESQSKGVLVTFCDVQNLYALLEQADMLPELSHAKSPRRYATAQFAFNKKRFPLYLASSLFMLFTSIFSYLKIYSLGWATAFMLLAIYSLTNKRFNPQKTAITLQ